jgi:hypothetical protein
MGLNEDIYFEQNLLDLKIDEKTYIIDYDTQYKNQIYILNENQMVYIQPYLACIQDPCGEQI